MHAGSAMDTACEIFESMCLVMFYVLLNLNVWLLFSMALLFMSTIMFSVVEPELARNQA